MKFIKEVLPYAIILIVVILIRSYIATPVVVSGPSMDDTLHDGQILLLKKYDHEYERNEIIVFNYGNSKLVKRVIGLPGEHVKYSGGKLYINGEEVEDAFAYRTGNFDLTSLGYETIPEGYYFVLGDNRAQSSDSRMIGLIKKDNISGSVTFRIWPIGVVK